MSDTQVDKIPNVTDPLQYFQQARSFLIRPTTLSKEQKTAEKAKMARGDTLMPQLPKKGGQTGSVLPAVDKQSTAKVSTATGCHQILKSKSAACLDVGLLLHKLLYQIADTHKREH